MPGPALFEKHAIRPLCFIVLALSPFAGLSAQDTAIVELPPLAVTGTHIQGIDLEPVFAPLNLSGRELARSGTVTLQEYVDGLPQAHLNLVDRDVLGFTAGASGINLRGAGIQYTLTLINGRRTASYALGGMGLYGFVNTNAIPLTALERIEVLPDGASAIYGSDAVTGVVNLILKKQIEGLETTLSYGNTAAGDYAQYAFSALGGHSGEQLSYTVGVSFTSQEALFARERSFSASGDQSPRGGFDWNSFSLPRGRVAVIEDISAGGLYIGSTETYTTEDLLNRSLLAPNGFPKPFSQLRSEFGNLISEPSDEISLSPGSERTSVYGNVAFALSPRTELFIDFLATQSAIENLLHPAQIVSQEDLFFDISKNNPYNPLGENRTDGGVPTDVRIAYRNVEAGPRIAEIDDLFIHLAGGFKGSLAHDFAYEVSAVYAEDAVESEQSGGFLRMETVNALTTSTGALMDPMTTLNVFGRFAGGPAGGDDFNERVVPGLSVRPSVEASFALSSLHARLSGPLAELGAGGPILFAAGTELRRERWTNQPDAATTQGDVIQLAQTPVSRGDREVLAGFVELQIPLHRTLDLQIAGRYESFDGETGDDLSPKLAISYQPTAQWGFYAALSEGFRAPSLPELFSGENSAFAGQIGPDPGRPGEFVSNISVRSGGNPDLLPEESETGVVGVEIRPTNHLMLRLTWSQLQIENQIRGESIAQILALNDGRVIRAPATAADLNQGFQGRVIEILNFTRNKARSTYETLDVYLTYEHSSETLGAFFATFNLSQMLSQTFQEDASVAAFDFTGEYRFPEFRAQLHTAWTRHSYGLFANLNYVDGYRQLVPVSTQEFFGITNLQNEVDPFMTLDLGAQGKVFDLEVTFELINVFDEEPPFTNAVSIGYDAWHSPVGRQYRLAVTKRF